MPKWVYYQPLHKVWCYTYTVDHIIATNSASLAQSRGLRIEDTQYYRLLCFYWLLVSNIVATRFI